MRWMQRSNVWMVRSMYHLILQLKHLPLQRWGIFISVTGNLHFLKKHVDWIHKDKSMLGPEAYLLHSLHWNHNVFLRMIDYQWFMSNFEAIFSCMNHHKDKQEFWNAVLSLCRQSISAIRSGGWKSIWSGWILPDLLLGYWDRMRVLDPWWRCPVGKHL